MTPKRWKEIKAIVVPKPRLLWSHKAGTYIKAKHGELK